MKKTAFAVFFSVVLIIYFFANFYVFTKAHSALAYFPSWQVSFKWVFILLAASYPVGRIIERFHFSVVSVVLHWTGAFWLGILLYGFLFSLLTDGVQLLFEIAGITPEFIRLHPEQSAFYTFVFGALLVIGLNGYGHIIAIRPKYRNIKIPVNKSNPEKKALRLALISDVHLGTIIGTNRLSRIVERINQMHADGVIIAGDLVDEDIKPVIKRNMGRYLSQLKGPVFAVTGNHEYIGGVERSLEYLQQFNIRYIRDEVLEWKGMTLVGREDNDRYRYTGKPRKSLDELMEKVDKQKPVLVIDHQPVELDEKQRVGVDFTISGHTHNGQNWPLNYITRASFKVSNGYARLGDMHVYVSTGVGGWGPPVRVGTHPEIVQIDLEFYGEEK